MSDLVEFLLARVVEDEAVARAASLQSATWAVGGGGDYVYPDPPPGNSYIVVGPWGGGIGDEAEHIARHDPARVLAECEAKRRIVDIHGRQIGADGRPYWSDELRALALPYADHPDYRDEWRP